MSKTLKQCLESIGLSSEQDKIITRISHDSRECDANSIYVGNRYEKDAQERGAFCVEEKYMGELLNYFYDDPSSHYFVIGVSGTNGKTSVTHFLKQMLTFFGYRCIRLGTQINEFEQTIVESVNTTMNVMDNLKVFLDHISKIDCIIMEVSSHAIEENRVAFIRFDRLIYTNITPEHLDYHLTFTHYKHSKFKLRHNLKKDGRILMNFDCQPLHQLLEFERERVISYGIKGKFQINSFECSLEGSEFIIENLHFHTSLAGEHTIMNLGAVLACIKSMGIALENCIEPLSKLEIAKGRMEVFKHQKRTIVIDYAHTPASLESVCAFLRKCASDQQKVICVFGCGGERDRIKRPVMAQIACHLCDEVIVSEDNNRNEAFSSIISDMKLERFENVRVIEKREIAVHSAFNLSNERDIILLAGKGNEQFLIAKGLKIPYNDKACICQCERG